MKRLAGLAMVAALIAGAIQPRHVEARGPSTPEERARFVALVHSLESDAVGEHSNATREQLRQWMSDVPDIRFKVCPELLASALTDESSALCWGCWWRGASADRPTPLQSGLRQTFEE